MTKQLENFIECLKKNMDNNTSTKQAILNNMYYHIYTHDLVNYIGIDNIANNLKHYKLQGLNVTFWENIILNSKIVVDGIMNKNCLDLEYFTLASDNYGNMLSKYMLSAYFPQLFICFPDKFNRELILKEMRENRLLLKSALKYDVSDLEFLMCGDISDIAASENVEWRTAKEIENVQRDFQEIWMEYANDKTPKNFIDLFDIDFDNLDDVTSCLLRSEIEQHLISDYECSKILTEYGDSLIKLHKRICNVVIDSCSHKSVIDEFIVYLETNAGCFKPLFDAFFGDMDNMYLLWRCSPEEINIVVKCLELNNTNSHVVSLLYNYLSLEQPLVESNSSLCYDLDSYEEDIVYSSDEEETLSFKDIVDPLNAEKLKKIVQMGRINDIDQFGETLIMNAVRWRQDEAVVYLVRNGANLNMKNRSGKTVLHMTCGKLHKNEWSYVPLLLQYGADPNIRCNSGKTAMMHAIRNHSLSTIKELKHTFSWFQHRRLVAKIPVYIQKIIV